MPAGLSLSQCLLRDAIPVAERPAIADVLHRNERRGWPGPEIRCKPRQTGTGELLMLNAANTLSDLKMPPGNRLEPLAGERNGQHSIRINDQYRICFTSTHAGPDQVEIADYH
jgi:proteic killer suppression protein